MTHKRAFTLVELLVVIAIIGILIALLLPAINAARESGRRSQCSNNQKQLGLGFVTYEAALGVFPPGRSGYDGSGAPANTPCSGRSGTSGFVYILPYVELGDIYKTFMPFANGALFPTCSDSTTTGWETPQIGAVLQRRPGTFVCPSDTSQPTYQSYPTSSYAMMMGTYGPGPPYSYSETAKQQNTGMFNYVHARKAQQVKDGLSHTIFLGEAMVSDQDPSSNYWARATRFQLSMRSSFNPINTPPGQGATSTDENNITFNGAFGSRHPGGANFCFGDGHVIFISENVDMSTYQAMSTVAGSENLMYSP
jgi:prepilin-type N-terminal cleavage/methylation domain-containing protein/prepilin-type processing-associated H-X9-DG protein